MEIYFFAYLIFFFAFWIGSLFVNQTSGRDVLYGLGAVLTLVGFGVLMAVRSGPSHGGVSFGPHPALIFFLLMCLVGPGLFTSALFHTFQGKRVIQTLVMAVVTVVPIGLGVSNYFVERAKVERAKEFRAEMELTNLFGTFGGYQVTLPVSPKISIEARCDATADANRTYCNARFGRPDTFKYFDGFGSNALEFSSIGIGYPNCAKKDCTHYQTWCARRPALKETAWCRFDKAMSIEMRVGEIGPREEDTNSPLLVLSSPIEGLRIRCARYYGSFRRCNAHFEVRPGVRVKLSVGGIEPGNEEQKVLEAKPYVEQLWMDMTRSD